MRNDGVLPTSLQPVDLQRRALPEPLQRGISGLPEQPRDADRVTVLLFVEANSIDLGTTFYADIVGSVVESRHSDPAVIAVQAGQDFAERMGWVVHRASEPSGVQVTRGAGHDHTEGDQPLRGYGQGRLS